MFDQNDSRFKGELGEVRNRRSNFHKILGHMTIENWMMVDVQ